MQTAVLRLRLILAAILLAVAVPTALRLRGDDKLAYAAEFANAAEVVPGNDVRVNDVDVGRVTGVALDGLHAVVSFRVEPDVVLPEGTRAVIRQTSLLGEYHVALEPAGAGRLREGAVIPLERTRRNADVEQLVALGGELTAQVNVDNLNRMLASLDTAFGDDPERLGRLVDAWAAASAAVAEQAPSITATIDGVQRLAADLAPRSATLADAVGRVADGLGALQRQSGDLGAFVSGLGQLSERLGTLLRENEQRLSQMTPQLRQVLGEVVAHLDEIERTVRGLPAFNRGWACATDGHYLNFVFPITPELARMDYGAGTCDPAAGPRARREEGQVKVTGTPAVPSGLGAFLQTTAGGGQTTDRGGR